MQRLFYLNLSVHTGRLKMKKKIYLILYIFFGTSYLMSAQNPLMAQKYLDQGDLDKAAYEYKLLLKRFPYNQNYLFNLIKIYQSQSNFEAVEDLLKHKNWKQHPQYLVYLGYNYRLQKDSLKARKYYQKAINFVKKKVYTAYTVGNAFKQLYLLNEAEQTYQAALKSGKNNNLLLQLALIYAEKDESDKMMQSFLNLIESDPKYSTQVKYYLTKYITQDPENENNIILKNQLIQRIKADHQSIWYHLLQWLYTEQKSYKKAFLQLKSLYYKKEADIGEIYHLAQTASYHKRWPEAKTMYRFIIAQNKHSVYNELSKLALLKLDLKTILTDKQKQEINQKFKTYLTENWSMDQQIKLKIAYADFLAFHQNKSDQALAVLSNLSQAILSKSQKAAVNLKKGDILLHNKKFNQALVLYTQTQLDFPNNEIGHQATYDIARASFFQGDIDWAHAQLKVIKSAASDLIANDALELDLLIINNKEDGDTIQAGLKELAQAKFEIFRKNRPAALKILEHIKQNYKGQLVYDDALMAQAKLYEQAAAYQKALEDYQAIVDNRTEDLLKDDALFRQAVIYEKLGDLSRAESLFKKIVLNYPASFWFVDARKHFRQLRGDKPEED